MIAMPVNDAMGLMKALPSSEYIRGFFHDYASVTHLAGKANDEAQAQWTRDKFIEFGIQDTKIETYYPMLNYPVERRLAIVKGPEHLLYEAKLHEKPTAEDSMAGNEVTPTFHGNLLYICHHYPVY